MGDKRAKDHVPNILQNIKLKQLKDRMGQRSPSSRIYSNLPIGENKMDVVAPIVNPSINDTQDNTGQFLASISSGAKDTGRKEDSFPSEVSSGAKVKGRKEDSFPSEVSSGAKVKGRKEDSFPSEVLSGAKDTGRKEDSFPSEVSSGAKVKGRKEDSFPSEVSSGAKVKGRKEDSFPSEVSSGAKDTGRKEDSFPREVSSGAKVKGRKEDSFPSEVSSGAKDTGRKEDSFPSEVSSGAKDTGRKEDSFPSEVSSGAKVKGRKEDSFPSEVSSGAKVKGRKEDSFPSKLSSGAKDTGRKEDSFPSEVSSGAKVKGRKEDSFPSEVSSGAKVKGRKEDSFPSEVLSGTKDTGRKEDSFPSELSSGAKVKGRKEDSFPSEVSSGAKDTGRKEDSFPSELSSGAKVKGRKEDFLSRFKDQPKGAKRSHYSQKSKKFQKYKKFKIFTEQTGPQWHNVVHNIVTKPIIASNLSKAFEDFPIFGKPENSAELKSFQDKACQQFVGLSDEDYAKESAFCSPDFLLTGREMEMASQRPSPGHLTTAMALQDQHGIVAIPEGAKLRTLKKLKTMITCGINQISSRKLKYRGVRLLTLHNQEGVMGSDETPQDPEKPPDLEPGKDVLYRVRVYRPFVFSRQDRGQINIRGRHSVFNCDVVLVGKQPLTDLRDRIVCRNDLDLRLDMSEHPDLLPPTNSKESFPSNFMFINNVFYVDNGVGCRDTSAVLRRFAERRGLGTFPVRDMARVCVAELAPRLAHPEVYVHQGNCEHVFQFSEIRLLNNADPLHLSAYPCHTAVSQNQMLYCNNCAEFAARWIVTNSQRVPFDPAFFCETCFRSYMYVNGKKVENFKAYLYKGNEINMLKPNLELERLGESGPPVVRNQVMIHI